MRSSKFIALPGGSARSDLGAAPAGRSVVGGDSSSGSARLAGAPSGGPGRKERCASVGCRFGCGALGVGPLRGTISTNGMSARAGVARRNAAAMTPTTLVAGPLGSQQLCTAVAVEN